MACLLVPAATAVVTTVLKNKFPAELKLEWLNLMLWGGFAMLLVDHILSGEIIFTPPFFTAGFDKILTEILVVGLPMTFCLVVVWAAVVVISIKRKRPSRQVAS